MMTKLIGFVYVWAVNGLLLDLIYRLRLGPTSKKHV